MHRTNNQSEVARILHDIAQEYEAAYAGLHGPALVGPHRRRTSHTEQIGVYFEELEPLVGGPENAMHLIAHTLDCPGAELSESAPTE